VLLQYRGEKSQGLATPKSLMRLAVSDGLRSAEIPVYERTVRYCIIYGKSWALVERARDMDIAPSNLGTLHTS
jgi:hypothetical protein